MIPMFTRGFELVLRETVQKCVLNVLMLDILYEVRVYKLVSLNLKLANDIVF